MSASTQNPSDRAPGSPPVALVRDLHNYSGIGQPLAWITRGWQASMLWVTKPIIWHLQDRTHLWIVRQLANIISTLRIVLGIILAVIMARVDSASTRNLLLALAILVVLTDGIDGAIARGLKTESTYGKAVDPLADKAFFISFAFALLTRLSDGWVDGLVYFLVALEFVIALTGTLVGIAARQTQTIPPGASNWGKHKFTMECIALLLGWVIPSLQGARLGARICLTIAVPLAISSLYTYAQQYWALARNPQH